MKNRNCDILIFTALVEEHRAAVEIFLGSETKKKIDEKIYLTIGLKEVGIICLSGMGNINSAVQATINIALHRPKYIILCGIAGGIKSSKELDLGDIIVAEQVILYESSKVVPKFLNFGSKIKRRTQTYRASRKLLTLAKHLDVNHWPDSITGKLKFSGKNHRAPRIFFGPIASGEKVVANRSFLKPIIKLNSTLKGIEMEAGGISLAADAWPEGCESIVVKSICDWSDHTKVDDWHMFSSYASAVFVKHLVDKLIHSSDARNTDSSEYVQKPLSDSTTEGLFIEFLNPESQRIYDFASKDIDINFSDAALAIINASVFLCEKGVVFPIGTFLETPYLMSLLQRLQPLINEYKVRFSIREKSIEEFLTKRRRQYRGQERQYPNLFKDIENVKKIPEYAFVSKQNRIGVRIAEEFHIGPRNLSEWTTISNLYSEDEIQAISQIPNVLVKKDKSVTWTAFEEELSKKSIKSDFEIRRLLQITYCRIYASEYALEFLQNVDLAPVKILPTIESRRYDYGVLKRILLVANIWQTVSSMKGEELLSLCNSDVHQHFMIIYNEIFVSPVPNDSVDKIVLQTSQHFEKIKSDKNLLGVHSNELTMVLAQNLHYLSVFINQND